MLNDAREYTGEWQNNKKQAQMLTKISMRRRRGKKLKHYIGRIWMWPASNNRASKNQMIIYVIRCTVDTAESNCQLVRIVHIVRLDGVLRILSGANGVANDLQWCN